MATIFKRFSDFIIITFFSFERERMFTSHWKLVLRFILTNKKIITITRPKILVNQLQKY